MSGSIHRYKKNIRGLTKNEYNEIMAEKFKFVNKIGRE